MNVRPIALIAGEEFRVNSRNRWIIAFGWLFALLTLAVSYFGMVTTAQVGFQGFTRTTASLLNLVLYLVPMVALVMGVLSFSAEGGSELLLAQPVTRTQVLVGKLAGIYSALVVALLFGFSASGLVIALQAGGEGIGHYVFFVAYTLLLALVFAVLGSLVSIAASNRARAIGAALAIWFFFVVFYDLLIIGAGFLFRERTANLIIFLSLFGNPVDLARVASLISLGGATIFGAAGAALLKFLGGAVSSMVILVAGLLAWVALPFLAASMILRRRDV
ncbi:MAG TPA: ABC transporter permease subunit [Terriglobales bacterium]|nr:ABC transporter permease subunit [Terriglobales bacterium]